MSSFLRAVFCCLGKRVNDSKVPDERTRFINPSDVEARASIIDAPEIHVQDTFDRARIDDRLQSIVQAKEGKMINVNAPLPFNLYNKPAAVLDALAHNNRYLYFGYPSRSASVSTAYGSHSSQYRHAPGHRPPPLQLHSGLEITPITPTQSATFDRLRSRSASMSGSPPRPASSLGSSRSDAHGPEDVPPTNTKVLGVRLVKFNGMKRNSMAAAAAEGRRGRPKIKKDFEEVTPRPPLLTLSAETNRIASGANEVLVPGGNEHVGRDEDGSVHPDSHIPFLDPRISDSLDFLIRDVGMICADWED